MIKDAGLVHQHKVGSTRQAVKAAEAGVDVVSAAGFEMGGHAPSAARGCVSEVISSRPTGTACRQGPPRMWHSA
jgi:NAD(P)H-dependent flavin oxidoreductase YrpB (nitropropane dioxygenase family)